MSEPVPRVAAELLDICYQLLDGELSLEDASALLENPALVRDATNADIEYLVYWLAQCQDSGDACEAETFGSVCRYYATRLFDLNRNDWSVAVLDAAEALYRQFDMPVEVARCGLNRANTLQQVGQYEQAIAGYDAAEAVFRAHGLAVEIAGCRMNRANVQERLGRYREAIAGYDAAEVQFRESGLAVHAAGCRMHRALVLERMGRYTEALAEYDAVEPVFRGLDKPLSVARCRVNRGHVLRELGQFAAALREYEEARPAFDADHHAVEAARCRMSRGVVLERLDRYKDARDEYDSAEPVFAGHGLAVELARCRANRARARAETGEVAEAVAEYEAAEPLFREHQLFADAAGCRVNRADLLLRLGRAAEAVREYRGFEPPELRADDRAKYHFGFGRALWESGERDSALAQFALARKAIRHARRGGGIDDTSLEFVAARKMLLREPVGYALAADRPEEAFAAVQDAKAGILGDFRQRERPPADDEPDFVIDARAAAVRALRAAEVPPINALAEYLRVRRRAIAPAATPAHEAVVGLAEVQAALPPDWALLDFWVLDAERVTVFVVTAAGFRVETLPNPEKGELFSRRMDAWIKATSRRAPSVGADDEILDDLGHWLAPLRAHLGAARGVYLVPHGWLHRLPLHAARRLDGLGRKVYLCDEFAVAYLPSAAMLPPLPPIRPDGPILSLANPEQGTPGTLPFSDWEATRLRERVRLEPGWCHVGPAATYDKTADWETAAVVHLSCHGIGDPGFAPASHLRLADDLLLAHDVVHRRPPLRDGSLVVLSGCETAVRDIRAMDEGMGLMSAFLLRGASLVLASQWTVADACAAEMVQTFLGRLVRDGTPPAEAFRAAQERARAVTAAEVDAWRAELAGQFPADTFPHEAAALGFDAVRHAPKEGRADDDDKRHAAARLFRHPIFWAAFHLVGRVT